MSNETRATEAELTRSYYDASETGTKRMIVECDHEEAIEDRPFVVEATPPRCMTGRPLRIQIRPC